ncbi:MAG TPA: hypothetical protein VNT51_01425 [Miltoncostaeaceae bacterium]|nr:hypothetical protein [Miltoncostaeaceae bacterium]
MRTVAPLIGLTRNITSVQSEGFCLSRPNWPAAGEDVVVGAERPCGATCS